MWDLLMKYLCPRDFRRGEMEARMKKNLKKMLKKTKLGKIVFRNIQMRNRKKMVLSFVREMKVNDKQIIFSSFQGRLYSCSPKAIYEYMISNPQFDDYKFIWAFNKPEQKQSLFTDGRTVLVKYNSKDFFKYLASSKYWIFNFKTPEYFIKKENQIFLQCWHGTPLKRIGMDIEVDGNAATDKKKIHESYLNDAKKYDYFISPSRYATERFVSSFGLKLLDKENIIIEQGYPRNDKLKNFDADDIMEIKRKLNISSDKKVILYCPTFRDDQYKPGVGHTYQLGINLLRLKEKLGDGYFLLLRLHYLVSNKIDISQFKGFALDVSSYDDINDLYLISDVLVTDYSSVFFDFANLNRPMIFYMYDRELYQGTLRDFYLDLKDIPGPIIEDECKLIEALRNTDEIACKYQEKIKQFSSVYNYLDDGHATERTIKELMNNENNK